MSRGAWLPRFVLVALMLAAAFLMFPYLAAGFRAGAGALLAVMYLAAYLFMAIALPLMAFALLRFVYRIFLRPYWRLWRIQRWRNARDLKEVMRRQKSSDNKPNP